MAAAQGRSQLFYDLLAAAGDGEIRDEEARIGAAMAEAMLLARLHPRSR